MSPHAQSSAHPAQRDAQRARGKSRPVNNRLTATPPRESYAESSGTAAQQPPGNRSGPVTSDVAITRADEESNGSAQLGDACWICAEPFKYYSVSKCGHRTCHVCALRLRELYKRLDCTFCKVSLRAPPPTESVLMKNTMALRSRNRPSYSPRLPMRHSPPSHRNRSSTKTSSGAYGLRRRK
jgi:hypothetical protein